MKTVPLLSKVDDIHAICSLLKDFLRNLKEPLLTSWLSRAFMEAAGEGRSSLPTVIPEPSFVHTVYSAWDVVGAHVVGG